MSFVRQNQHCPKPQAPHASTSATASLDPLGIIQSESAKLAAAIVTRLVGSTAAKVLERGVQSHLSSYTTAKTNPFTGMPMAACIAKPGGHTPTVSLSRGMKGPQVEQMQSKLVQLGYMTSQQMATGPGSFWNKTDAAVRHFQKDHGLEPNGVVDADTQAAMRKAIAEGQTRPKTPAGCAETPREPAPVPSTSVPAPPLQPGRYDGTHPAPGTTSTRRGRPVDPPLTNGPGQRSADAYAQAIDQFAVGNNPRFAVTTKENGKRSTWCNIFLRDVTRAMGAEIPHEVDKNGNATAPGKGNELNANETVDWMHQHGERHGWHKATPEEAQKMANQGHPAVVVWKNTAPRGHGHLMVVRPGEMTARGVSIAHAGSHPNNSTHVGKVFGRNGQKALEYWVHD